MAGPRAPLAANTGRTGSLPVALAPPLEVTCDLSSCAPLAHPGSRTSSGSTLAARLTPLARRHPTPSPQSALHWQAPPPANCLSASAKAGMLKGAVLRWIHSSLGKVCDAEVPIGHAAVVPLLPAVWADSFLPPPLPHTHDYTASLPVAAPAMRGPHPEPTAGWRLAAAASARAAAGASSLGRGTAGWARPALLIPAPCPREAAAATMVVHRRVSSGDSALRALKGKSSGERRRPEGARRWALRSRRGVG